MKEAVISAWELNMAKKYGTTTRKKKRKQKRERASVLSIKVFLSLWLNTGIPVCTSIG